MIFFFFSFQLYSNVFNKLKNEGFWQKNLFFFFFFNESLKKNSFVFWFGGGVALICNSLLLFGHLFKQILFIVHMKSYLNFQTNEKQLI